MEIMKLNEVTGILCDSARLRIIKGKEILYAGFLASMRIEKAAMLTGEEEVEKLSATPEITHRQWKERGLIPPFEPMLTAQYAFSDMELKLYYDVYLK